MRIRSSLVSTLFVICSLIGLSTARAQDDSGYTTSFTDNSGSSGGFTSPDPSPSPSSPPSTPDVANNTYTPTPDPGPSYQQQPDTDRAVQPESPSRSQDDDPADPGNSRIVSSGTFSDMWPFSGRSSDSGANASAPSQARNTEQDTVVYGTSDGDRTFVPVHSHFGFMAPLMTGKLHTGFMDLDGDGESGTISDAILYNLLFGDSVEVTQRHSGGVANYITRPIANPVPHSELPQKQFTLTTPLANGRTQVSSSELLGLVASSMSPAQDRRAALEALLQILVLRPAWGGENGPIFKDDFAVRAPTGQLDVSLRKLITHITKRRLENPLDTKFERMVELAIIRLSSVLALTETTLSQSPDVELSNMAADAARASIYALTLELKRANLSTKDRASIISELATTIAAKAPLTMDVAAKEIVTPQKLADLQAKFFDLMPAVTSAKLKSSKTNWSRRAVGAAVGATVVLLWMNFGPAGLESITHDIDLQYAAARALTIGLPALAYKLTTMALARSASKTTSATIGSGASKEKTVGEELASPENRALMGTLSDTICPILFK